MLYLTKRLEKSEDMPDDFVGKLRRKLENAKVEAIEQHKFDRVAVLRMRTKEATYQFIIELFANGNLIICDENFIVLQCLRTEEWKDRVVKMREKYIFPHSLLSDPATVDDKKLSAMMGEKHIIATLARTVPIGTAYLEEALARAEIDPKEVGRTVETKRLKQLAEIVRQMATEPQFILYEPPAGTLDFACFELLDYETAKATRFATFSECIDEAVAKAPPIVQEDQKLLQERAKLLHSIEDQKTALVEFEKEEKEARAAAEAIFSNYEKVEAALKDAKEKGKNKIEIDL
jgi:predicted ribosome quality control (RQC) complex YloA/Tae2 family protein